jgi:hypothetical protein
VVASAGGVVYVMSMQGVSELINKIFSQYQFFNYIITGGVFLYAISLTGAYTISVKNFFLELLVYYAVGFFLSRLGSATIEPILKKIGYIEYADYAAYLRALKKEPILDDLAQLNNIFKTAMTAAFVFGCLMLIRQCHYHDTELFLLAIPFAVSLVFMHSYKKQTTYIGIRVKETLGTRAKKARSR